MTKKNIYNNTKNILLLSALFNGFYLAFGNIQDIIAKKAFGAVDWQLTLLAMLWPVTNFFSIWWGKMLEQSENKAKYFIIVGILGRLSLLLAYFASSINFYLIIYGWVCIFNGILSPATNSIYQSNFPKNRSKIFGMTISVSAMVSVIFAFFAGRLLDADESNVKIIFICVALAGFVSSSILSLVKIDNSNVKYRKKSSSDNIFTPITRAFTLLKTNKPFAHFQRNFTLYGFGFLSILPVIPIFLVDHLNLNYTESFISKGILAQVGLLILSPIIGKYHDRFHPFKFATFSFACIALFPLLLLMTGLMQSHFLVLVSIYSTYLVFGLAMASVNVAWNMSSIHFAGDDDVSMYQSLHVTITGIRGLIAPILGIIVKNYLGIYATFIMSFIFFALASILSYRDYKRYSLGLLK